MQDEEEDEEVDEEEDDDEDEEEDEPEPPKKKNATNAAKAAGGAKGGRATAAKGVYLTHHERLVVMPQHAASRLQEVRVVGAVYAQPWPVLRKQGALMGRSG